MTQKIARVNDLVQSFVSPMRRGKKTAIAQWQKRNSFTKDGGSKYYSWLEFTWRKFRIPLAVLDLVRIPVNKVRKKEVKKVRLNFIILSLLSWPWSETCFKCSRNSSNGHLSTTATFFGGQSIHWLLFKPLYNGHFFMSLRWPFWTGSTVHRILIERVRDLALKYP